MSCPEPNTCPIIDEVVDHLDLIEVELFDIIQILRNKGDVGSLLAVSRTHAILGRVVKANLIMDDIRIANAAIRSWGEEQEDKAKKKITITNTVSGRF